MRSVSFSIVLCIVATLAYNSIFNTFQLQAIARLRSFSILTTSRVKPPSPTRSLANMTTPRRIQKAFLAKEQSEGVGARVRRSIGTAALRNFSPFLMLDHFSVSPGAGFPDHPHR